MSFVVAAGVGPLQRLSDNIWYGTASQELIESTLQELQSGNTRGVIDNLNWLKGEYEPTYENRAHYNELVSEYVDRFGDPGL